jgi:acetyltransferase-like isoleucine patch superfamily enzyme
MAEAPVEALADASVLARLRRCGKDVRVFRHAQIIKPEVISIGDGSQIDDFVWLLGGQETVIGRRVHIATHCSIGGGGRFAMEDYSGFAAGVRVVTGSDDHNGEGLTNPCIPMEYRSVKRGCVMVRKHALVFTGAIILPDVEIGEGAVVAAGTVVRETLEPWTIYGGARCIKVAARNPDRIRELEAQMVQKYGY